jgi:hypothetical protein
MQVSDELPYFASKLTREESEMIHRISPSDSEKSGIYSKEGNVGYETILLGFHCEPDLYNALEARLVSREPSHSSHAPLSQTSRIKKTTAPRMQSPKVSYLSTKQMNAFLDRACSNQLRLMPCRAYFGHISW